MNSMGFINGLEEKKKKKLEARLCADSEHV